MFVEWLVEAFDNNDEMIHCDDVHLITMHYQFIG